MRSSTRLGNNEVYDSDAYDGLHRLLLVEFIIAHLNNKTTKTASLTKHIKQKTRFNKSTEIMQRERNTIGCEGGRPSLDEPCKLLPTRTLTCGMAKSIKAENKRLCNNHCDEGRLRPSCSYRGGGRLEWKRFTRTGTSAVARGGGEHLARRNTNASEAGGGKGTQRRGGIDE